MEMSLPRSSNPKEHIKRIQSILTSMKEQCRGESEHFSDSRARALLETTADVLDGLERAYQDYLSDTPSWHAREDESFFPQKSSDPWD